MSAAPATLHRYLAAVPAMSLIPFAPCFGVRLGLQDRHDFGPSRTGVSSAWQASGKPATVLAWAMGDKSPKDKQKQATQKQTKNEATNRQKGQAVAAKQAGNSSKRSK